jgi:hypothetical protein
MKRTQQRKPATAHQGIDERRELVAAELSKVIGGDVYMHDPKGSNGGLSGGGNGG